MRHVFKQSGIDNKKVVDYVAELLTQFSRVDRIRYPLPGKNKKPMDYLFEMMEALLSAQDPSKFLILVHIGNHALFFSGLYINQSMYFPK